MVTMLRPRVAPVPARAVANKVRERLRGSAWRALRERVLRRNPLCVECAAAGRLAVAAEVDHVTPIHQGGSDDAGNLQGLCHACHREKTAAEGLAYAGRD